MEGSHVHPHQRERRNGLTVWDDPVWRNRIVKLYERTKAAMQTARRARVPALNGGATRVPLQRKLVGSEIALALHETAMLRDSARRFVSGEVVADATAG